MTEQEVKKLLIKYERNECTPAEKKMVDGWYIQTLDSKEFPEGKLDLETIGKEMWNQMDLTVFQYERKIIKLWTRISVVAAAVVATVIVGLWLFSDSQVVNRHSQTVWQNDISPGRNKATLMLDNGKTISLSDAQTGVVVGTNLKYNDGTVLDESLRFAILTAATPRGGTYQITLQDGTKVWLNAESTLKFPSSFTGSGQRQVILKGEAYFEVTKNKTKPFIVVSKGQQVEVLGTHFNINAYDDEISTKTTLLEGSVRVSQLRKGIHDTITGQNIRQSFGTVLKPNEQSIISNDQVSTKSVDVDDAIDWKNGEFVCKNEPLNSIMRKISRWYDVDVIYAHPELKTLTFSGSLSRYDKVSGVLSALEQAGTIRFKLEGRKIQVL
ncbi:FecR family protein [Pedobacter sp. MC2016-24]|uniref:FecR family protein n=1 Tax=Pedobacter sp. MC2016-24 TaxID=2780090 RepID=UPI001882F578|nr:FecR family protein [Pedobacter sp. MC2016-24]MBE9602142.1 DUF4974 domain-containing protein [Pedobacter sp. MC2016-24]